MADARIYEVAMPPGLTPAEGLARARAQAEGAGVHLEGDEEAGTFRGTAEGRYRLANGRLRLEVDKKPGFLPWSLVEVGLRQVFGDVESVG